MPIYPPGRPYYPYTPQGDQSRHYADANIPIYPYTLRETLFTHFGEETLFTFLFYILPLLATFSLFFTYIHIYTLIFHYFHYGPPLSHTCPQNIIRYPTRQPRPSRTTSRIQRPPSPIPPPCSSPRNPAAHPTFPLPLHHRHPPTHFALSHIPSPLRFCLTHQTLQLIHPRHNTKGG